MTGSIVDGRAGRRRPAWSGMGGLVPLPARSPLTGPAADAGLIADAGPIADAGLVAADRPGRR